MANKIVFDFSEHNTIKSSDWDNLKKMYDEGKCSGIILRIGLRGSLKSNPTYYGKIRYDFKFKEYLAEIKKRGLPYSVYFFPTAISENEAHEEGEWLVQALKDNAIDPSIPICQDSEIVDSTNKNGRADKLSKANRTKFINIVNQHLKDAGYDYGIYASTSWFYNCLNDNDLLEGTYRWVAQYASKCTYKGKIDMWQYTSKYPMSFSKNGVDASYCYSEIKTKTKTEVKEDKKEEPKEDSKNTETNKIKDEKKEEKVMITEADCINKMIEIASNEVGYLEKKSNSNLYSKTGNAGYNNYTKYGYEMHKIQPSNMDFPAAWCFPKGVLVLTDNGYKDISEIQIGDKVLSADGTHFNNVINISEHEDNLYKTTYIGNIPLISTGEHPVYSKKRLHVRKDAGFTDPNFNPVKELKKGDSIGMTITKIDNNINLSYDEAWLIGYYVGDGWKSRNDYYICGNEKKSIEIEMHTIDLYKEKMYKTRTCQQYILKDNYKKIFPILDHCGNGAWHKHVPVEIFYANNNIKRAFLNGYLSADGSYSLSSNIIKYNSVSKELAMGINKIATDLGYGVTLQLQHRNSNYKVFDERYNRYRKIKTSDIYNGTINLLSTGRNNSCEILDGYSYHTIKSVSDLNETNIVYNMTTDGDHTYTANNVAVHNCDAFVDWIILETCKAFGKGTVEAKKVLCGNFDDYTVYSSNYYKKKDRWFTKNPKAGDQIFFKNNNGICHTGIVYKVDSSKVYTIEGNTSSASGVVANGGCVAKKSYSLSYSKIAGYGRPDWSSIVGTTVIVSNDTNNTDSLKGKSTTIFTVSGTFSPNKTTKFVGTVTASSLNIRKWAGTENEKVSFSPLANGSKVNVCDAILDNKGTTWYYINYSNKFGFVSSNYIKKG